MAGWNYLADDYVYYNGYIWQCPPLDYSFKTLDCSIFPPEATNPQNPWILQDYRVVGSAGVRPTITEVEAPFYLERDIVNAFDKDDMYSYQNRVWRCMSNQDGSSYDGVEPCDCEQFWPGVNNDCWELTRYNIADRTQVYTVPDVDYSSFTCVTEYLMINGVWNDVDVADADLEILISDNGIVCEDGTSGENLLRWT